MIIFSILLAYICIYIHIYIKLKIIEFTYEKSYFNSNSTRAWHISVLNHQDTMNRRLYFGMPKVLYVIILGGPTVKYPGDL